MRGTIPRSTSSVRRARLTGTDSRSPRRAMLRSIRRRIDVDPTDARSAEDDRTKPHGRDQNRFRSMALRQTRQTERSGPGGWSDRPQEPTPRRCSRRGIRARRAHARATGGSSVEGAGSDGRWTGTVQDRQVASLTVASGKNRAVLSALCARSYSGGNGHSAPGGGLGPESPGPSRSGERPREVLSGRPYLETRSIC